MAGNRMVTDRTRPTAPGEQPALSFLATRCGPQPALAIRGGLSALALPGAWLRRLGPALPPDDRQSLSQDFFKIGHATPLH